MAFDQVRHRLTIPPRTYLFGSRLRLGRELARRIAMLRPKMQIIFMSGYTNQAVMNHTALPASVRYLEKPIPTALLLRAIREAMVAAEEGPPLHPAG
jgi:FixJ family two-component response regulator